MDKINMRTAAAILLILAGVVLVDQTIAIRILSMIQSVVVIITGITITLYLWKRM